MKRIYKIFIMILCILILVLFFVCGRRIFFEEQKEIKTIKNTIKQEDNQKKEAPVLIVQDKEIASGERVKVNVKLKNNPGILGMSLVLSYDENFLTLEKAENGEAFDGILELNQSEDLSSGCSFIWMAEKITEEQTKNGTILSLEFLTNKVDTTQKTPIILLLDQDGIYDNDVSSINLSIDNGYITIVAK